MMTCHATGSITLRANSLLFIVLISPMESIHSFHRLPENAKPQNERTQMNSNFLNAVIPPCRRFRLVLRFTTLIAWFLLQFGLTPTHNSTFSHSGATSTFNSRPWSNRKAISSFVLLLNANRSMRCYQTHLNKQLRKHQTHSGHHTTCLFTQMYIFRRNFNAVQWFAAINWAYVAHLLTLRARYESALYSQELRMSWERAFEL